MTVTDTGIGIPEDLLPRVFDLFTQDRRTLDRAEGGLGLGLAIARRLTEMHRGRLEAHSAGPGCGSEFRLSLPAIDDASDRLVVLIVDDNEDAALTLQTLMNMLGHQATVAFNGETAIDSAESVQPDLVLLDIGLPGVNGYEVARRLRGIPALEGVTLAAVTGYSSPQDRQEAMEAGFDFHFAKPVTLDQLLARIPALAPR